MDSVLLARISDHHRNNHRNNHRIKSKTKTGNDDDDDDEGKEEEEEEDYDDHHHHHNHNHNHHHNHNQNKHKKHKSKQQEQLGQQKQGANHTQEIWKLRPCWLSFFCFGTSNVAAESINLMHPSILNHPKEHTEHKSIWRHGVDVVDRVQHLSLVTWPLAVCLVNVCVRVYFK